MKHKLGIFSFTCCEGCTIQFIELLNKKFNEYKKKFDFINVRVLKPYKKVEKLDIAFIEGAISKPSELKKLKEIRKKAKAVVAIGSGAINGYPSNLRNKFTKQQKQQIEPLRKRLKQFKTTEPITKFIKVDYKIGGCPVLEKQIEKCIKILT